ncbi:MAG: NUDIX hydrolase [Candidatus Pacebacteria bacterium CG10_big_fil_rev_8_21_14_0_10_44_54]|nr:NUDIX domain-containing protein [bacterium]PIR60297.1 MAG: NUDIX hydrolase [Candidatus Pacebacteria bacterium CG10_big_fil_rev_8_21_14_0_10_44_54]
MRKNRYKQIVAVHLILRQNEKILFQLRKNTGYGDGSYSLPGGHVEAQETAITALQREMQEELCIEFDEKDISLAHVSHRNGNDHERIDFFFSTKKWRGEVTNGEPDKCDGFCWATSDSVPGNLVDYIASALKYVEAGEVYSQFGW